MKKRIFSLLTALVVIMTMLPFGASAEGKKVNLYGNSISAAAKQVCFVRGNEEENSFEGPFYDTDFKQYFYVGNETVDFKLIAKKLPELQSLSVVCCDVKNTNSLAELDKLVWLGLYQNNGAEDLSFLKNLTGLKKFKYTNIYGDKECESIKPIAYLKNLTELSVNVKWAAIEDITPLSKLTKMKKLTLKYVGGDDVSILKSMKNLRELELDLSDETDMTFLKQLTKLEKLDVTGDTVGIGSVAKLKKMKELHIGDSDEDLSFIGEMTQLETLFLSYTNDSFTSTVGNLKKLKDLTLMDIDNGGYCDLSCISKLESLESLFVFGQYGLDIIDFSKLKKLKDLSIWLCEFDDLSDLKKCKALESLVVYNCNSDFDVNWIADSDIKNVSISSGGDGRLKNIDKFTTLSKMESLMLDFTGISEDTVKKIKKALPKCKIEVYELSYGDYEAQVY